MLLSSASSVSFSMDSAKSSIGDTSSLTMATLTGSSFSDLHSVLPPLSSSDSTIRNPLFKLLDTMPVDTPEPMAFSVPVLSGSSYPFSHASEPFTTLISPEIPSPF